MPCSNSFLEYAFEQLSFVGDVSFRAMMGEYVVYYKGKVIGGIYDDRLLIKPVEAAKKLLPNADYEIPYVGAKEMLLIDNLDDTNFLTELFASIYPELPTPKARKKSKGN